MRSHLSVHIVELIYRQAAQSVCLIVLLFHIYDYADQACWVTGPTRTPNENPHQVKAQINGVWAQNIGAHPIYMLF